MTLPTEIQLEIFRYALIAEPPQIHRDDGILHNLLDISNSHIQGLVEDLVFHTATMTADWDERLHLGVAFGRFLQYHDRIHGSAKRHLIHVKVVDRPTKEPSDEEFENPVLPSGDEDWEIWAEATGVSVQVEGGGTLYPAYWPFFPSSCWWSLSQISENR